MNPLPDHPTTADLLASRSGIPASACPGLLRIVPALDGGICRVKLPGGEVNSTQARVIAGAAADCASGVLELTNRSNLQIRGVRPDRHEALIERLLAAGLGPRQASADDVRNILLSPAAGLDPQALLDTRPLASELLDLLQDTPALHALSPKFAIQLDGGEALAMLEHPHDLWFSALPGQPARLAFGLAGSPLDTPLGSVEGSQVTALVEQLLRLFLEQAAAGHTRMRHLLVKTPASRVLEQLQGRLPFALQAPPADWQRAAPQPQAPIGTYPQRQADRCMVAAVARLGRIDRTQLQALADLAEQHGDATLRLTPWQGLLLPNIPAEAADAVLTAMGGLGLLTDAGDPLASLIACTGSSACAKGLADSKADALRLAQLLRQHHTQVAVHLSGCSRSCAAAHVAPFTLLASEQGRYQLYQRTPGVAGFGLLQASALDIDQAGDWLAAHCATGTSDA